MFNPKQRCVIKENVDMFILFNMYNTIKTMARKSYYIDMFCLINVEDIHHKAA